MRKQLFVLFVIFIAGLFFSAVNNGNPKACGTKTAGCKTLMQKELKDLGTDHIKESDPSLFLLVNPLIH